MLYVTWNSTHGPCDGEVFRRGLQPWRHRDSCRRALLRGINKETAVNVPLCPKLPTQIKGLCLL